MSEAELERASNGVRIALRQLTHGAKDEKNTINISMLKKAGIEGGNFLSQIANRGLIVTLNALHPSIGGCLHDFRRVSIFV